MTLTDFDLDLVALLRDVEPDDRLEVRSDFMELASGMAEGSEREAVLTAVVVLGALHCDRSPFEAITTFRQRRESVSIALCEGLRRGQERAAERGAN
jgi:hypothetical protein